jgi:two-component system, OmpR family, sensor kinase
VTVEEKGDLVQVSVADTGPGLTPEEQAKVFDMFYQVDTSAKRAAGGAGLGLAIARGIVTMHGGEMAVHSEKGAGATFRFMVPRNKEQKAA